MKLSIGLLGMALALVAGVALGYGLAGKADLKGNPPSSPSVNSPSPTVPIASASSSQLKMSNAYFKALRTADQFLIAWQNRDWKTGETLVTDRILNEKNKPVADGLSDLQMYFLGLSNPHHEAFEILGSDKVNDQTYRFQVWMYDAYNGYEPTPLPIHQGAAETLEVVKVGEDQMKEDIWKVDRLP